MITLAEKGIKYTDKLLSFGKKEHKSAEVLALNPRGQLPTLKLGDTVINESLAACDYIEDQYSNQGTKLMPDDPKERALVIQRKHEAMNLFKKGIEDYTFFLFKKPTDRAVIEEKKDTVRGELNIWDGYVKQTGAYVAGKRFTAADVVFYPSLAFMVRMGLNLDPKYPSLDGYYKRVSDRPSVKSTWPPHWKDGPRSDMLNDV